MTVGRMARCLKHLNFFCRQALEVAISPSLNVRSKSQNQKYEFFGIGGKLVEFFAKFRTTSVASLGLSSNTSSCHIACCLSDY